MNNLSTILINISYSKTIAVDDGSQFKQQNSKLIHQQRSLIIKIHLVNSLKSMVKYQIIIYYYINMKLNNILIVFAVLVQYTTCIQYSSQIGMAFSISALALAIPHQMLFKNHLRMLDLLQLCYLIGSATGFTSQLSYSWISFIPNFWSLLAKSSTSYLNTTGSLLSFGACLFVTIIITWIFTIILRAARKTTKKFHEVFAFFKGLIRWVYLGLIAMSVLMLVNTLSTPIGTFDERYYENIIGPAVTLFFCALYPIWLLCARSYEQKEDRSIDSKQKWAEFFSLLRLLLIGTLLQLVSFNSYIFIGVYIAEAIYFISSMFLTKWDNCFERIIFTITEGVIVTIFSLTYYFPSIILSGVIDLDFYLITAAFGLEVIYQVFKYIRWIANGRSNQKIVDQSPSIVPFGSRENLNLHQDQVQIQMRSKPVHHKQQDSYDNYSSNPTTKKNLYNDPYNEVTPVKQQKNKNRDNDNYLGARRK